MPSYPNWFKQVGADLNFSQFLTEMPAQPRFLQIGAFVGHASEWLLRQFPEGVIFDVDTWEGSAEEAHEVFDWADVERSYDERMAPYSDRVIKCKTTSDDFFAHNEALFDFIYIDGAHTAAQVLTDGIHAARSLKPGGIIAFDDYTWGLSLPVADRPQAGIDIFLSQYRTQCTLLEMGLQVWVRWTV
jgi:predicted O-methyltransferase YrrM